MFLNKFSFNSQNGYKIDIVFDSFVIMNMVLFFLVDASLKLNTNGVRKIGIGLVSVG